MRAWRCGCVFVRVCGRMPGRALLLLLLLQCACVSMRIPPLAPLHPLTPHCLPPAAARPSRLCEHRPAERGAGRLRLRQEAGDIHQAGRHRHGGLGPVPRRPDRDIGERSDPRPPARPPASQPASQPPPPPQWRLLSQCATSPSPIHGQFGSVCDHISPYPPTHAGQGVAARPAHPPPPAQGPPGAAGAGGHLCGGSGAPDTHAELLHTVRGGGWSVASCAALCVAPSSSCVWRIDELHCIASTLPPSSTSPPSPSSDFTSSALPWGEPDWAMINALLPASADGPSPVLSVTFDSMTYPVTVDGIHTVSGWGLGAVGR